MGEAKRKNQRSCPALDRTITAAECGSSRNTKIPCPADCPHNPFAPEHYLDLFGPLEQKVIDKLSGLLVRSLSPGECREIARSGDTFNVHALHVWHLHGRGLLDRWIEAGDLDSWKNDDRFMARCFGTTRVALTEILRIEDEISVIVRDLLQPELGEIRLIDTAFVRNARRFDLHLGWIYQIPAGWRSSGAAIQFTELGAREPEESLDILLRHLGAPETDRQPWLLEHMMLLKEAIMEVAQARRQRSFEASDLREVTRDFSPPDRKLHSLADRLRAHPRMDPEKNASGDFKGHLLEAGGENDGLRSVVGHVSIDGGLVQTRAISMARADKLREFLLELEPGLRQERESVVDLGEKYPSEPSQPDLVPEALLEGAGPINITQQQAWLAADDKPDIAGQLTGKLLDTPVPILDGLSPREAVARPDMKTRVARLMKGHVSRLDRMRREQGLDVDLNPQLAELGLDELIQPPPPVGERPAVDAHDDSGHPARPLLTGDELLDRLKDQIERRDEIDRQIARHEGFFEAIAELPYAEFSIEEIQLLSLAARFAVFTLHPDLPRKFHPQPDRMMLWFDQIYEASAGPDADLSAWLETMVAESGQPDLVSTILDFTVHAAERVGGEVRDENKFEFILAVCAVVREVNHWPWHR